MLFKWQRFRTSRQQTGDASLLCQFPTWRALHDTRHDGNTMNTMKKNAKCVETRWQLTAFTSQAKPTPPPHTHTQRHIHKEIAELRRVKLDRDSGFNVGQSAAVCISVELSPMTSAAQHTPVAPVFGTSKPPILKRLIPPRTHRPEKSQEKLTWKTKLGKPHESACRRTTFHIRAPVFLLF